MVSKDIMIVPKLYQFEKMSINLATKKTLFVYKKI